MLDNSIKIAEMKMQDIQRISIKDTDTIIVRVDLSRIPPRRYFAHQKMIKEVTREAFPDVAKILILPKDIDMLIVGRD